MEASPCIVINPTVAIPLNELRYRTTRSGGRGGPQLGPALPQRATSIGSAPQICAFLRQK
jgi:hypothetical protein